MVCRIHFHGVKFYTAGDVANDWKHQAEASEQLMESLKLLSTQPKVMCCEIDQNVEPYQVGDASTDLGVLLHTYHNSRMKITLNRTQSAEMQRSSCTLYNCYQQ